VVERGVLDFAANLLGGGVEGRNDKLLQVSVFIGCLGETLLAGFFVFGGLT